MRFSECKRTTRATLSGLGQALAAEHADGDCESGGAGRGGPVGVEVDKLEALRRELVDLAYERDLRGEHEAADLASMVAARLEELIEGAG